MSVNTPPPAQPQPAFDFDPAPVRSAILQSNILRVRMAPISDRLFETALHETWKTMAGKLTSIISALIVLAWARPTWRMLFRGGAADQNRARRNPGPGLMAVQICHTEEQCEP
jgi:hypothetical protein